MIIYVIIGSTGEYSDRNEWPVCWRESQEEAQALVNKLNAEAVEFKKWDDDYEDPSEHWKQRQERMKAMTDPSFACYHTGTSYGIWAVTKEPRP